MYNPDNPELELVWRDGRAEEVSNESKEGDRKSIVNEENIRNEDTKGFP